MARAPEATEFEEIRSVWLCINCKRVAADPEICDYCEFPRFNQPDVWAPQPGMVTIDTDPTADPEGVDPGSHGGML